MSHTIQEVTDAIEHIHERDQQNVVIACDELWAALLAAHAATVHPNGVFEFGVTPIIDESDYVNGVALTIQRLTFERGEGWFSGDLPDEPDFDLR